MNQHQLAGPESPTTPRSEAAIRVLLVEDDDADARFVHQLLTDAEPFRPAAPAFELTRVGRLSDAVRRLDEAGHDAVLLDLMLPDSTGLATLNRLRGRAPDVMIVVLTGLGDQDLGLAREAVRGGAQDFLPKSEIGAGLLRHSLLFAIERAGLERRRARWPVLDRVTGLPARIVLQDRFERAAVRAQRHSLAVAILSIELDRLGGVVEAEGTEAGDRLLRDAAGRLTRRLRGSDTVARLRPHGFTVLLEGLRRPDDAALVAKHLLHLLIEPFQLDGREIRLGASIGIALHPWHGRDLDDLLAASEGAMVDAALGGGGRAASLAG